MSVGLSPWDRLVLCSGQPKSDRYSGLVVLVDEMAEDDEADDENSEICFHAKRQL